MKLLLIILLSSLSQVVFSQTSAPVFKWRSQEISKNNNLQGMSVQTENTAVIAGYGGTFQISANSGLSWNDVGLFNPRYNFNDISFEGSTGYLVGRKTSLVKYPTGGEDDVFTNGILLKTSDHGENWSVLNLSGIGAGNDPGLNPNVKGCITLDPFAVCCINDTAALLYVQWSDILSGTKKTHSAVFKTTNGGINWKAITKDFGSAYINSIKRIGKDIYIGGNKILQKASVENDEVMDLFPAFSSVAGSNVFINDFRFYENEIYVQTLSGCFISTDNGKTFSKISGITGGNDFFKLNSNVMLSLGSSTNSRATTDGGITWQSCFPGKTIWEIPGIFNDSVYALASSVIYKIAVNDLQNGNYKWLAQHVGDGSSNLQKLQIVNSQKALLVGNSQIAKRTENKGVSWSDLELPKLFMGSDYDFRSVSAAGKTAYVSSRYVKLVDYPSGEDYYLNGIIYKTDDVWNIWKVLNTKNIGKDSSTDASKYPTMKGCYKMDNYTLHCVDANTVYMYVGWSDTILVPKTETRHSRVFKTTDGGELWTAVTKDFGSSIVMSIQFSGETGYLAGNKILQKTNDGGKTFTDLYPIITLGTDSNLVISSVVMHSRDEVYFQTSNNKGLFVTKDGGSTFTKLGGVTGGLDFVALDSNSFMSLGTSSATKFTNNAGSSWSSCSPGATIYAAGTVFNDSLYVLGKSNVYKVAVSDLDIKTFVAEVKSPNPFKVFYRPAELEVVSTTKQIDRCLVYSISGQLVDIVEPRSQSFRIGFNSFTPGIYIVAAFIDGKKYTQKVIFK